MQERSRHHLSDDLEIEVQAISPIKSLRLLHKLMNAAVPAFAAATKGAKGVALKDIPLDGLADAAAMLFNRFSADDQEEIVKQLLENSILHKGGKQFKTMDVIAIEFLGRVDLLYRATWEALKVNYQSFWPTVRDALAAGAVAGAPVSSLLTQSPGR